MKKVFIVLLSMIFFLIIPTVSFAQPRHPLPPPGGYRPAVIEHCYTVLIPFPHRKCEIRYLYNYTPAPPPPRRHTPMSPPPKGHPGPSSHHHHHGHHK